MFKNVDIFLSNYSQYDVQQYFDYRISEAFQRQGIITRILQGEERFLLSLKDSADLGFTINGWIRLDREQFSCNVLQKPQIVYAIDPAFHFARHFNSKFLIFACDDKASCAFLDFLKIPNSLFMPHAVEKELTFDPLQERLYDISFLASFIDFEKERGMWNYLFPPLVCAAMEEAVEMALADEITPFALALIQTLSSKLNLGADDTKEFLNPMIEMAFKLVERYIKGRDRVDLINAVSKSHLVHLFGNAEEDWKKYFQNNKNVIVHPSLPYVEGLEIMRRSKIVLNSSIKNKQGAHERIFAAIACGAVVITNDNMFLRETFIDGKDIILYRRSHLSEITHAIQHLLGHEDKRMEMVHAGRAKVMAHHTWDHRIKKLLRDIEPIIKKIGS